MTWNPKDLSAPPRGDPPAAQGASAAHSIRRRMKQRAALHLGDLDKFVGLVGLVDGAGAADHGGEARPLELAGLGGVGAPRGAGRCRRPCGGRRPRPRRRPRARRAGSSMRMLDRHAGLRAPGPSAPRPSPRTRPGRARGSPPASGPGGRAGRRRSTHSRARMLCAVPPWTMPMVRVAPLGVNGEAGSASCLQPLGQVRSASPSASTASIIAETPRCGRLEWASRPVTVTRKVAMPLWPCTATMSVGSPTTTSAGRRAVRGGSPRSCPARPGSRSPRRRRRPGGPGGPARALAPGPARRPGPGPGSPSCRRSRGRRAARRARVRTNGSLLQGWPSTGTTSVWPDSTTPPGTGRADGWPSGCSWSRRRWAPGASGTPRSAEIGLDPFDQRAGWTAARWCRSPPASRAGHAPRDRGRRSCGEPLETGRARALQPKAAHGSS